MFCDLYSQPWNASFATNVGQNRSGDADVYAISNVYSYTLDPLDPGKVSG
jgi:hypothetical protein